MGASQAGHQGEEHMIPVLGTTGFGDSRSTHKSAGLLSAKSHDTVMSATHRAERDEPRLGGGFRVDWKNQKPTCLQGQCMSLK